MVVLFLRDTGHSGGRELGSRGFHYSSDMAASRIQWYDISRGYVVRWDQDRIDKAGTHITYAECRHTPTSIPIGESSLDSTGHGSPLRFVCDT